ncbi:MAG: hypothetical protein AABN34_22955 [Acidobacteriota bacterium]
MSEPQTRPEAKQIDKERPDLWLSITIGAGAVIIIIFGFFMHLLKMLGWNLQHSESWEVGALSWTALFVVYYFLTLKLAKKDGPDKTIMLFLLLIVAFTVIAGISLLLWPNHYWHAFSVTMVGTFLMLTDRLLAKYHRSPTDRRAFRLSYLLAGVPMVIAYLVLDAYVVGDWLVHRILLHTEVENPEVFFSGAISFQLLVSNVIFVLIQKGVIENTVRKKRKAKPGRS